MKKRNVVLLVVFLAVALGGVALFMNMGFDGRMHGMMMDGPRHIRAFHGHPGMADGPRVFQAGGMMAGGWMVFGVFALLFQLAMIAIGWIVWKTAKQSGWKWAGMALMGVGIIVLLPKVLLIPFVLFAAYMLYKKRQAKTSESFEPMAMPITPIHDFLDEWEKKTEKEEK